MIPFKAVGSYKCFKASSDLLDNSSSLRFMIISLNLSLGLNSGLCNGGPSNFDFSAANNLRNIHLFTNYKVISGLARVSDANEREGNKFHNYHSG